MGMLESAVLLSFGEMPPRTHTIHTIQRFLDIAPGSVFYYSVLPIAPPLHCLDQNRPQALSSIMSGIYFIAL
jgi:hypothetical protein